MANSIWQWRRYLVYLGSDEHGGNELIMKYTHWKTGATYKVIGSVWEFPTALVDNNSYTYEGKTFTACNDCPAGINVIFYENEEGRGFARSAASFDEVTPNGQPRLAFVEGSE